MAIATQEQVLEQLGNLVHLEHLGERLLERASRSLIDPREVAHVWALATEFRDHARILRRHRREIDRHVAEIEYPSWPRGQGPTPEEALEQAAEIVRDLAGEYRSTVSLHDNPFLKKFLHILGEEHDRVALVLDCLVRGNGIQFEFEEALAS
jgi:hypothetical protein